jgi:hypothetical protein
VLTVHQENVGTAADYGNVGFEEDAQGSFLLFPKSLKRFEGRRVVGIKYDLIEKPPAAEPSEFRKAKPKAKPAPRAEPPPKPEPAPAPPKFEPLRVFRAQDEKPSKTKPRTDGQRLSTLTRAVRNALKKLEQGNSVAAYQILEKAVAEE